MSRDVCESYAFLGRSSLWCVSAPHPHDRNYIGMSLVLKRADAEGLLLQILCRVRFCRHCCVDGGGFSVADSVWVQPGATSVSLWGDFRHRSPYVRNAGETDAVTDLAGGFTTTRAPGSRRHARLHRFSPAGGDYSTSVVGAAEPTPPSATDAGAQQGAVQPSGRLLLGQSVLPGVPALQHHVHQSRPEFSCQE